VTAPRTANARHEAEPGTGPSKRSAARARKLVLEVANRHFGGSARRIVERGGGLTNAVYQLKVSQGEFIVRTHENATKIHDYLKEQWAMDAARAAGVPTPRVLEVGNFVDGRPYMIAELVRGIEGPFAPGRLAVVEQMGRAAALMHDIRTQGFGTVFDWSSNSLSKHSTWAGYLAEGLDVEGRLQTLLQHRMIGRRQAQLLRRTAARMARWRQRPGLHHGDLRLKNVIVEPAKGRIAALIDWESCASMPGPAWDLSLALHDLGVDEKEAFLEGYGMKPKTLSESLPFLRCFNVLNYANAVRSAAEKKKHDRMAWLRLRLAGELDLYEP